MKVSTILIALTTLLMIGATMGIQTMTKSKDPQTLTQASAEAQAEAQQQELQIINQNGSYNWNNIYSNFLQRVLRYIRNNGLYIGNWWLIREEGQVLVFRDYRAQRDSRYAMYRGRYVDL
eukprot:403346471